MAKVSTPADSDGRLYRSWTLWYLIPDRYQIRGSAWTDYLHEFATFDTIDEMWAALNAVGSASHLPKGSRFYIFRNGVQPLWEDKANAGGKLVSIEHQIAHARKANISERWIDVVLSILGESISQSSLVNGVEFTVRKGTYNIAIWLAPCQQRDAELVQKDLARIVNWKSPVKVTEIEPSKQ